MPRLSLWKDGKHTNDYKFLDRRISEMFTIGGTGILLHKYLGTTTQGLQLSTTAAQTTATILNFADTSMINIGDTVTGAGIPAGTTVIAKDASSVTLSASTTSTIGLSVSIGFSPNAAKPSYTNQSAQNIQDLLFVENRDRKYDQDVYKMRGIYQVADQDFDLSQFGLFLQTGTLFMVFHYNDMLDQIGRKLMAGDVIEIQHLVDYDPLNADLPAALKRFFVIGDTSFASEGYSPTWWGHLWRVKLNPLVDSQEYKDILNNIKASDGVTPLGQLLSTYDTTIAINNAVIKEAEGNVPQSGYDTTPFWVEPDIKPDKTKISPSKQEVPLDSYLVGDGFAPDGYPVIAGIEFPASPSVGDYVLRTDYLPNRLFRYNGSRWVKMEDIERTGLTPGAANNTTQFNTFVNDTRTWVDKQGHTRKEKQSLSQALRPKADNQ